jgi:hypothetical protein
MGPQPPVLQSYYKALGEGDFGSRERIWFRRQAEIFLVSWAGTIVFAPDCFFNRRRLESTV